MIVVPERADPVETALRLAVATLAVATAWIHFSLGSWLFTLNGVAYATLAAALVAPIPIGRRFRWLVRLAMLGFTTVTIAGWVMFGARFWLAYADKGIELLLIGLLFLDVRRADGGMRTALGRLIGLAASIIAWRPAEPAEANGK